MTAEPTVRVTEYTVSLLPEGNVNWRGYRLVVAWVAEPGWWRVEHRATGDFLSADGTWARGPWGTKASWLANHCFDLSSALCVAREVAPTVTVNGLTVADVLARSAR